MAFSWKIIIFSTEYRNKSISFKRSNEDLTSSLNYHCKKGDKGQTNRSFRELSSGVLKLLHKLMLTCYTKYTFLLSALNC